MGLFDGSDGGGFMGLLANPQTAGLLGMAGGLLQASGPSRIPVSMGQAMGAGFQGMGQGAAGALNTQRQLMQMQAMQGLMGMGQGAQSAPAASSPQASPSYSSLFGISTPTAAQMPQAPAAPMSPAGAAPAASGAAPGTIYGKSPQQLFQQGMLMNMAGIQGGGDLMRVAVEHDPTLAMQMPTDAQRMAAAAYGYGTPQYEAALQSQVQRAGYIPPTALRTPIYFDPASGTTKVVPADQLAAGYGAQYGAEARAQAKYKIVQVWDPTANGGQGGYVYQSQANVADASGSGAAGATTPASAAIVTTESGGNPSAVSPKGAQGAWQVMPNTQSNPGFGVMPARDNSPAELDRVGHDYYNAMVGRYGNPTVGAIAYNMGPGATDKWLSNGARFEDLPQETRNYVGKVSTLTALNGMGVPQTAAVSPPAPSRGPMAAQPPLGTTSNANTAQNASAKVMADDYENMQQVRQNAPAVLQAYDHLLDLAKTGGWQGWAANGGLTGKLMSTDAATYASPAAAEYDKTRAYLVNAGGSAMGEHNTDAARANLDRMIPEFGKPTQAKLDGIQQARNQTAMTALRANLLTPIFKSGDSKTYTDLANQFDNSVKPEMVPALTQLMQIKDPATANAAIQQAAQKYGPIGDAARLLQQHGLIVGGPQ